MPPKQAQQQQQPSPFLDPRTVFGIGLTAADIHTAAIRPFTRSGNGIQPLGIPGVLALLLIVFYGACLNAPEMFLFFWAWLVMLFYRRFTADRRQHTQFQGYVWALDWCIKDPATAHFIEFVALWAIGWGISFYSEPLGLFVSFSFFSFGFRYIIDLITLRRRKESIHNAHVEMDLMQQTVQQYRGN